MGAYSTSCNSGSVIMNAEEIVRLYAAGVRDFTDSQFEELNLYEADLSGVDLSNSNLSLVCMSQANLNGANLSNTDMSDCDLTGASLKGANLSGANLNCADLSQANLNEANLCNANLSYSTLNGADLENADLRGANLDDVEYDETTKFPKDFDPSSYKGMCISEDTVLKYEWIKSVQIAKSWDKFSDAMGEMGLREEARKILHSDHDDDRYSYKWDIKYNDVEIRVSHLSDLDWDYIRIEPKELGENAETNLSLYQLQDAIESGKVELILFLYT